MIAVRLVPTLLSACLAVLGLSTPTMACSPHQYTTYFDEAGQLREMQESKIRLITYLGGIAEVHQVYIQPFTSIDLTDEEAEFLSRPRVQWVIETLKGGGLRDDQIVVLPPNPQYREVTSRGALTDPFLSNYIQLYPNFLRDGVLVNACGGRVGS